MAHENLQRDQHVEGSSDSAFGLVFAGLFVAIACWPLFYGEAPRWWGFGVAAGLGLITTVKRPLLTGPNRFVTKLAALLANVSSTIAMRIIFYVVTATLGVLI